MAYEKAWVYLMTKQMECQGCVLQVEQMSSQVVHVTVCPDGGKISRSTLISEDWQPEAAPEKTAACTADGGIRFLNRQGETLLQATTHGLTPKAIYRYVSKGEAAVQTKHTANGDVAYIANARQEPCGTAFHGRIGFRISQDEHLYGLGQHEDGLYDYRGQREYLYQNNMKITIPFLISSRNYGVLIDTESALVFEESNAEMFFELETVSALSYYVITGDGFDEIIATLRLLTGRAPMLPRWACGYIQSKERYRSAAELVEVADTFRRLGIPVDCIVQDWHTWPEGMWGEKHPDPVRYPDPPALVDALHTRHLRLMVSIWPNMTPLGQDYRAFQAKGLLLPNAAVYDAFREEGRALYWQQCEAVWFAAGVDAWWCDNAEPFSDADWSGAVKRSEELRYRLVVADSEKSMDWTRLNTYGLYHAKGIYENWRSHNMAKRVVNLTRSTYAAGQRYGVVAWSGDLSAKWSVLQKQITEGIKFCMSGAPYWTLDIGGFFTVRDRYENRGCDKAGDSTPLWFWDGDYNDGVHDLGYRELYVRWLQYAAFLPMFRAHGTDTPREPWQFGKPDKPFYDTIIAFIRLRYRLLPYIYATMAAVTFQNDTMLRSLMFDFAKDSRVAGFSSSFMFGRALLICPVTRPMYYAPGSVPLENVEKTWPVYLPEGVLWYDFWTHRAYAGGQTIVTDAPLERMPIYVRAGSILPMAAPMTYADEQQGQCSEIMVFGGADGTFTLYNDAGDGYGYENGEYAMVPMRYTQETQTLTLGGVVGHYPCQTRFALRLVSDGNVVDRGIIDYAGEDVTVCLA